MSEIRIEPATATDLPAIRSLLLELLEAMDDTGGMDIERAVENCRSLLEDSARYLLVAREDGEAIGFIDFTTRKTILHARLSGLIDELVVSRKKRGGGIGHKLVEAAVEKCRELGCCEVEVSTEKTNRRARRFYRACGFEEDAVLLELDLE